MTRGLNEMPVSLEKLDDHLKALLRLKIREFVHLSPWFKNVDTIEQRAPKPAKAGRGVPTRRRVGCPYSKNEGHGRRTVRASLRAKGLVR